MNDVLFYSVIIVGLGLGAVCAWLSGHIASQKGHDFVTYALIGFFLPVVGLIVAAAMPDKRGQQLAAEASRRDRALDGAAAIANYKALLDSGAMTQEEFDEAKARVLDGMGTGPDRDNPLTLEFVCRSGTITAIEDDGGKRRQFPRTGSYIAGDDPKVACGRLADEIERDTGRLVRWSLRQ